VQNALIFCNRKRDVDILYKSLTRHHFSVGALHGDMSQPMRFATLEKFKAGETRLLCCSDVAARGLDIGGLSHVFNFDVPHHPEDYVHRIGRTGRAGREGRAFTLATPEDKAAVDAIEQLIRHPIPRMVVEALDPVDWAEGDNRRRGRGRAAPKREAREPPARKREEPKAAPQPEHSERAPEPPREQRESREPRGQREPREPRQQREPRAQREPRQQRDEAAPTKPAPRRERGERRPEAPREQRDEAVQGFGDDVPAFMNLPFRPRRPSSEKTEA
jgi:superfamily II DNA/RNA helicase